jgi:hypothetical protein
MMNRNPNPRLEITVAEYPEQYNQYGGQVSTTRADPNVAKNKATPKYAMFSL